jgi:hypothetical protein
VVQDRGGPDLPETEPDVRFSLGDAGPRRPTPTCRVGLAQIPHAAARPSFSCCSAGRAGGRACDMMSAAYDILMYISHMYIVNLNFSSLIQ